MSIAICERCRGSGTTQAQLQTKGANQVTAMECGHFPAGLGDRLCEACATAQGRCVCGDAREGTPSLACPDCDADVPVGKFPVEDGKRFECHGCCAKLVVHVDEWEDEDENVATLRLDTREAP